MRSGLSATTTPEGNVMRSGLPAMTTPEGSVRRMAFSPWRKTRSPSFRRSTCSSRS